MKPKAAEFGIVDREPWQNQQPQAAIAEVIHLLHRTRGADLTQTIYQIEKSVRGVSAENYSAILTTCGAKAEALGAAG